MVHPLVGRLHDKLGLQNALPLNKRAVKGQNEEMLVAFDPELGLAPGVFSFFPFVEDYGVIRDNREAKFPRGA